MKFLQTGDWHLGKIFHETSLIQDQKSILSQITGELTKMRNSGEPYDALLVPGDIYDRAVPPPEAVTLLSSFLTGTHDSFPELHIFILAGNHDSADRLSFASQILDGNNIHICTDTEHLTEPVIIGEGSKVAAVYQIPFLHPGEIHIRETAFVHSNDDGQQDLFTEREQPDKIRILRTQQELVCAAAGQIQDHHRSMYAELPSVVCAHLFAGSGHVSDSERSCIGTAEQVDACMFEQFTYTALGHLHGVQKTGKKSNIWYSGSPLAYSFDDSPDTFMLSVTIEKKDGKDAVTVNKIQFKPLHAVIRLTGPFKKFYGNDADKSVITENTENYIEIVCTDNTIPENPMALLRQNFHYILSFRKQETDTGASNESMVKRRTVMESSSTDKPEKLFDMFIQDVYGGTIPSGEYFSDERKLFLKLADNYSWTEDQA
jgi:DNA repair protein SbcD/Mre11